MKIDTTIHKNFFTDAELDYISMEFSAMAVEKYDDPVKVPNGIYHPVSENIDLLINQKISKLPNEILFTKLFVSTTPAGVHADINPGNNLSENKPILVRTIIIPLDTYDCGTVVFNQQLNYGETNDAINHFPVINENEEIPDFLSHINYDHTSKLSIETLFSWNKGDMLFFDRRKLHCSTSFSHNMIDKRGLVIWTVIQN